LDVASGGPSRSVPALAENQAREAGVRVTVLFRDRGKPLVPLTQSAVEYCPIRGSRVLLGSELGDHLSLDRCSLDGAVLHLHGLWDPLLHDAAGFACRKNLPYVVSTRGMLAGWALGHKAWKKKAAWKLYQRNDLARAACLVASSEFEQRDVATLLPGCRVEVVPNGCETRPGEVTLHDELPDASGIRWALAMGRLHPVKGYGELIEAWAALNPPGWKLAIAGPDENGYRKRLEEIIAAHALANRVFLLGEVGDSSKWSLLDQCELFVAPSKTENFGMAIAEALQSGTPVITTTGTPWRQLREHECGWWVENGPGPLLAALTEATTSGADRLRAMGEMGRQLITDQYTWDRVAARTTEMYRSILQETRR
jgi:glycosyltransferase involved in cell wall biosynthesis